MDYCYVMKNLKLCCVNAFMCINKSQTEDIQVWKELSSFLQGQIEKDIVTLLKCYIKLLLFFFMRH
jgi:hypothetical protein